MAEAAAFVEGLKRHLKARKMTYAEVAKSLRVSEASVKRMFSKGTFTLDRFEQICQFAGTSLTRAGTGGGQRQGACLATHARAGEGDHPGPQAAADRVVRR